MLYLFTFNPLTKQADSIGGSDDIHEMHDEHKLKTLLEEAGLEIHGI